MADCGHGLPGINELLNELDRLRDDAQRVWIDDAAGQMKGIVVLSIGPIEGNLDREGDAPIRKRPRSHVLFLRRYDNRLRSRVVERLSRFRELDLLEPIGDEDC